MLVAPLGFHMCSFHENKTILSNKMKVIILLFAVFAISVAWPFPPLHDETCKYTRMDALRCALKYGDQNKDNVLTVDEIQHALDTLVPWYIRDAPEFLTHVGVDRILNDCDFNKDGVLTPRDWELSVKTCMPKQQDLCQFKWFCDRAG